jgi:hypothetical protein
MLSSPDPRHPRRLQAENPLFPLSEFPRPGFGQVGKIDTEGIVVVLVFDDDTGKVFHDRTLSGDLNAVTHGDLQILLWRL